MKSLSSSSNQNSNEDTGSIVVAHEVISKTHEMIKTVLPRITLLYQLNDELERNYNMLVTKVEKMEADQINLHYQMRTSNLILDSKVNKLINDYVNVGSETSKMKSQKDISQMDIFIEDKIEQSTQKNIQIMRVARKKQLGRIQKKISLNNLQEADSFKSERISKEIKQKSNQVIQIKVEQNLQKQDQKVIVEKTMTVKQLDKESVQCQSVPVQARPSRQFKKSNLKSKNNSTEKKIRHSSRRIKFQKSQKSQIINLTQNQSSHYEMLLKEVQTFHTTNQKIKKNYEQLMAEYCRNNQAEFRKLTEQVDALNSKVSEFDVQMLIGLIARTKEDSLQQITKLIQNQLLRKIDKNEFEPFIIEFNKRMKHVHQSRREFAIKEQTKKAIQFLDRKINSLINNNQRSQSKKKYISQKVQVSRVEVDKNGCFKGTKIYIPQHQATDLFDQNRPRWIETENILLKDSHQINNANVRHQVESLNQRIKGSHSQNRFNEQNIDWKSIQRRGVNINTNRSKESLRRNYQKDITLLKNKSVHFLTKDRPTPQQRHKKQLTIFEYS